MLVAGVSRLITPNNLGSRWATVNSVASAPVRGTMNDLQFSLPKMSLEELLAKFHEVNGEVIRLMQRLSSLHADIGRTKAEIHRLKSKSATD